MKYCIFIVFTILFFSCGTQNEKANATQPDSYEEADTTKEQLSFFPVGDFINGQITAIKREGINPMKIKKTVSGYDTSWLRIEDFEQMFTNLFSPKIDSTNVSLYFTEKKFFDKTMDAFTFTYDPHEPLPDSIPWRNWIVYIDPENNEVNRIYLVKQMAPNKISQITWIPKNSCSIVTIANDANIEEELKIVWNFKK